MVSKDQLEQIGLKTSEVSEQARTLLIQDFYWSPIDDFSPFGNDDGSDAFHHFREWRFKNKSSSPVTFLNQLLEEWAYPKFDLTTLNETEISKYLETKGGGISSDQISTMREHFKQMSEQAGKEFKEEEFQQIMSMSSESMGGTYLFSQDNAVIAIGFGQFILEGKIDNDISELVKTAIQRELLPILITRFDEELQEERNERLNQMLSDLNKM
ncbi:MAG: hypothetical protein HRT61_22045 [Ekhidna sp.]|nr:hypothetical protein [Ekhidna sp.]